jgi:hypothetical protein
VINPWQNASARLMSVPRVRQQRRQVGDCRVEYDHRGADHPDAGQDRRTSAASEADPGFRDDGAVFGLVVTQVGADGA